MSVSVLRTARNHGQETPVWHVLYFWCPGCDAAHAVNVVGPDGYRPKVCWDWDGDLAAPTISPSILTTGGSDQRHCHSFVRSGRWEFLSDSAHALAGQTVDMVPLPDWLDT